MADDMPLADDVAPEADHSGNPFGDAKPAGSPPEQMPAPQGPLSPATVEHDEAAAKAARKAERERRKKARDAAKAKAAKGSK